MDLHGLIGALNFKVWNMEMVATFQFVYISWIVSGLDFCFCLKQSFRDSHLKIEN